MKKIKNLYLDHRKVRLMKWKMQNVNKINIRMNYEFIIYIYIII